MLRPVKSGCIEWAIGKIRGINFLIFDSCRTFKMTQMILIGLLLTTTFSGLLGQKTTIESIPNENPTPVPTITDTIIQTIKIKQVNKIEIEYDIYTDHYDSLGYSFGFGISGRASADSSYFPILHDKVDNYSTDYTFYHGGSDCYTGIGINKADPDFAIIITDNCVKDLFVTDKKLKMNKK